MSEWITEKLPKAKGLYIGLSCTEEELRVYREFPGKITYDQIHLVVWTGSVFTKPDSAEAIVVRGWQFTPARVRMTEQEKWYSPKD